MSGKLRAIALAVLTAAAVAGCGLGAGPGTKNASVVVTRDFGAQQIGTYAQKQVPGAETVMQMLESRFTVSTAYGGGFVESIDGHAGGLERTDWFYYVNGIEAPKGAAATSVNEGDEIWWDLHDWQVTDSIPAVVGSYPEPFLNGSGGKRYPTALACASAGTTACNAVAGSLKRAGVPVADQYLGGGSGSDSLTIVVGTWAQLKGVVAADLIDGGPRSSGVYARFVGPSGTVLELLNPEGKVVETLRADGGLIAALEEPSLGQPTWLVTGTDQAGVNAAAAALTPARLSDHFALAVDGDRDIPVPVVGSQ